MSFFMMIIAFTQHAATFIRAAVADVRRLVQPQADLFLKIGAYIVAEVASRATPHTVRLVIAELSFYAVTAHQASVGNATGRALVAADSTSPDLP
jgi:hypothetical protein